MEQDFSLNKITAIKTPGSWSPESDRMRQTVNTAIRETETSFQELAKSRTLKNFEDFEKLDTPELPKVLDLIGYKKPETPEKPNRSGLFHPKESTEIMDQFRDMVESYKISSCRSDLHISLEDPEIQKSAQKFMRGFELPISQGGEITDPRKDSNLGIHIDFDDSDTNKGKSTGRICQDVDVKENIEQITKGAKSKLAVDMIEAMDLETLDALSIKSIELEHELSKFSNIKMREIQSAEQTLEDAKKMIELEKVSNILKILEELTCWYPEGLEQQSPEDQKSFNKARLELVKSLELYRKAKSNGHAALETEVAKKANEAVILASSLTPYYKNNQRMRNLINKILLISEEPDGKIDS